MPSAQHVPVACLNDLPVDNTWRLVWGEPNGANGKGQVQLGVFDMLGSIVSGQVLVTASGAPSITLDSTAHFGSQLCTLGDVDNDGVLDIAVLAPGQNDENGGQGVVFICFLTTNGSIREYSTIARGPAGLTPLLNNSALSSIGAANDLNGDGVPDLLIGAHGQGVQGVAWAAFLSPTGTLIGQRTYTPGSVPGLNTAPNTSTSFGNALCGVGDVDGNGHADIAIADSMNNSVHVLRLTDGNATAVATIRPDSFWQQTDVTGFGTTLVNGPDVRGVGYRELLVGVAPSASWPGGAICMLDPGRSDPYKSVQFVTDGYQTAQGTFSIPAGLTLGPSCFIPDLGNDGVSDVLIMAPSSSDLTARFLALEHTAYPIEIQLTVTDQTPDALGAVAVKTVGGRRPYTYTWSKELQDTVLIDSANVRIETSGLASLGIDLNGYQPPTKSELEAMEEPILNGIPSGKYWVGVKDAGGAKQETDIVVGMQINSLVEIGVQMDSTNKDMIKNGLPGWTNMQLRTKNVLPKENDGWVRFFLPQNDKTLAVGFGDVTTDVYPGYLTMDAAFVFMGGSVHFWNGTAMDAQTVSYGAKSSFMIERKFDHYYFYMNDSTIHVIKEINPTKTLSIQASIYDAGGEVNELTTNFLSTFGIVANVAHCGALAPSTGSISVDPQAAAGSHDIQWSNGATTAHIENLAPGTYQAVVTNDHFNRSITKNIHVGNQLLWQTAELSSTPDPTGLRIHRSDDSTAGWDKLLLSHNYVKSGSGHVLSFVPYIQQDDTYGSLLGLRAVEGGAVWAGWWVHAYGDRLLANTITPAGLGPRLFLRKDDELQIVLHQYSIHYLRNGDLVHTATRPLHKASNILAAVRSPGSQMHGVWTTIPVPLVINTQHLVPNIQYAISAPDGSTENFLTGSLSTKELSKNLPAGPFAIHSPAVAATNSTTFSLGDGTLINLTHSDNNMVYPIDSSLYEILGSNALTLYDEPESKEDMISSPIFLSLHEQVLMTPNSDGLNDTFHVQGDIHTPSFHLTIKSLDNTIVFETNNASNEWNGKFMNNGSELPSGIYNYSIELPEGSISGQFILQR
jgi:gliding motility-associated-like protein